MALSSNLIIAVDSTDRNYNETGTLPKGKIRTASLSNGQAGLKISHEEKSGRDRGLVEFSEATDSAGKITNQKFHLVFDQPQQPNMELPELEALVRGGLTWLLTGDNLTRVLIGEY